MTISYNITKIKANIRGKHRRQLINCDVYVPAPEQGNNVMYTTDFL